ncbi:PIN domain-containing protein [Bacillus altitudinis]|uniref:PIN domain-containing protein n=1 Tax=Bacillus altitudinis TaxID=293387 RepID=UPI003CE99D2A
MKEKFREFYFDKSDEKIWRESIIVLDTNVLLNLYRYTKETSEQILKLLNKYKDNLWMPHQVGLEYHYNRKSVILEQRGSNDKVCDAFEKIPKKVKEFLDSDLSRYKKRHINDVEFLVKEIKTVIEGKVKDLKNISEKDDLLKEDLIRSEINELYKNRVGDPYTEDELKVIMVDADDRFSKNIPPGYKDLKDKKGIRFYNGVQIQNKYGDYILWRQVLDYAKKNKSSVIFLTDEKKEDWWYEAKGRTIGPRIELLNEFSFHSKKSFYMFSSLGFIEVKGGLDQSAVSEVKKVSEAYNAMSISDNRAFSSMQERNTPFQLTAREFHEKKKKLMKEFCEFIVVELDVFFEQGDLYLSDLADLATKKFGQFTSKFIMDILLNDIGISMRIDKSGNAMLDIDEFSSYLFSEIS